MQVFDNKKILITGGTGSWGNEITKQLLEKYNPQEIIIYSRNEFMQVQMERRFANNKLKFVIGDVVDSLTLDTAMKGVDYVFHLAALKHVPVCENNPWQSINTNIIGTQNIVRAAINNKIKLVVDCSSDKACAPVNMYGLCKAIGEKLIIHANREVSETKFVCTRAGNVIGTQGSIVPFFIDLIKKGEDIPITDFQMTRYYITLDEAIALLLKATEHCFGGEIFIPKMPACRIVDLAEVLIEELNGKNKLKEVGIRPGEKLHECLISQHESKHTVVFDDNYYVILPEQDINNLKIKYQGFKKFEKDSYMSNDELMNKKEIKRKLIEGGFI